MPANFYPVILAGGRGTRFWPLSRKRRAKQVLALDGDRTMMQQTGPRRERRERRAASAAFYGKTQRRACSGIFGCQSLLLEQRHVRVERANACPRAARASFRDRALSGGDRRGFWHRQI